MTDPTREQIDESSVHSDKSPVEAIQWTGENMGEVLRFAGHNSSSINSFGDPCVKVGEQLEVVEIGHWIIRDGRGWLSICSNSAMQVIREAKQQVQVLQDRIAKVRDFAEDMKTWCSPHGVSMGYASRLLAVLDGDGGEERPLIDDLWRKDWDSTEDAAYDKPAEHFNLSPQEWKAAAEARLAELGCTYTELEAMSRPGGYWRSMRHRKLWALIGGTLDADQPGQSRQNFDASPGNPAHLPASNKTDRP